MARKPNYAFERNERERMKAAKAAEKADAKRDERERERAQSEAETDKVGAPFDDNQGT